MWGEKFIRVFDLRCRNKKIVFLILVITLTYWFLPFHHNDQNIDDTEDKHIFIRPVSASSDYSSFHPWAFHSGSGKLHLIFLHEILDYDITIYHYYHTYELENGSWAPPKKIEQVPLLFDVEPTENGFIIYFGHNIYYHSSRLGYEESVLFAGIFKIQYSENLDQWSDPVELFGESHTRDYLKLSYQKIDGYLHSFFLQGDESLFVVWSFEFRGPDVNLSHQYEKTHILSEIDKNGVIDSHPIYGLEENYGTNCYVRIVEHDDFFYFYTLSYTKKAIFFPNGTCSNWYDSLMPENLSETLPLTMFTDHRVQKHWEVSEGQTISVVDKRYLVYHKFKVGWQILDLTSENLTAKSFTSPYNIKPVVKTDKRPYGTGVRTFDFELNPKLDRDENFVTPIFTNSTIELWKFNYGNTSWRKIGSLDYSLTNHYDLLGDSPIIELIAEDNSWQIFWGQEVSDGPTPLHEIFTVNYNTSSDEWSPVTQVTDTKIITDDFNYDTRNEFFHFFLLPISFLGVMLTFLVVTFLFSVNSVIKQVFPTLKSIYFPVLPSILLFWCDSCGTQLKEGIKLNNHQLEDIQRKFSCPQCGTTVKAFWAERTKVDYLLVVTGWSLIAGGIISAFFTNNPYIFGLSKKFIIIDITMDMLSVIIGTLLIYFERRKLATVASPHPQATNNAPLMPNQRKTMIKLIISVSIGTFVVFMIRMILLYFRPPLW